MTRDHLKICIYLAAITWLLWGCFAKANDSIHIYDRMDLVTAEEKSHITSLNKMLLEDFDIDIKIVILSKSPPDIDRKASDLFDKFHVGKNTSGARGVLFLLDPEGSQVRVEIGYDLESIFPDGFIGYIERRQMVPFFRANKVGPGLEATIELMVARATGEIIAPQYMLIPHEGPPTGYYSGGAGARETVEIGSGGLDKKPTELSDNFVPQPYPAMTLEKYTQVLSQHIKDPDLGLFTPQTREFFKKWLVTDAQQDNELHCLLKALPDATVIQEQDLAVIYFSVHNRQVSPYLLKKGVDGWMLDFATMNQVIGFNHKNQWFFSKQDHAYMFAFSDVFIDKFGFPH